MNLDRVIAYLARCASLVDNRVHGAPEGQRLAF